MSQPLMPKATAVWLVDNTALTFDQIAEFVGMHPLEISGIADGDVATGIKGADPVQNGQLKRADIEAAEASPARRLTLLTNKIQEEGKRKGPRYTPLSKRQDRPAAIAWLVRNHPELTDGQVGKLVGTTKPTIQAVREKTHWNMTNLQPVDPVALGFCKQVELDAAVAKARPKGGDAEEQQGDTLMPTEQSLSMERRPAARAVPLNAESLFNLPNTPETED